ncbi:zinc finger protein OZF-like [Pollicipes pollicipes]|uniref:zinc finger protein OZF-like n=1 Tax=Pollicipes pollicipes TaxID=41117 RepID=UPI001885977B|nr:zinc finger protein OZF-like [Pollicipes pollicipes]
MHHVKDRRMSSSHQSSAEEDDVYIAGLDCEDDPLYIGEPLAVGQEAVYSLRCGGNDSGVFANTYDSDCSSPTAFILPDDPPDVKPDLITLTDEEEPTEGTMTSARLLGAACHPGSGKGQCLEEDPLAQNAEAHRQQPAVNVRPFLQPRLGRAERRRTARTAECSSHSDTDKDTAGSGVSSAPSDEEMAMSMHAFHLITKMFICGFCGQSFRERETLIKHAARHGSEKSLCSVCGETSNERHTRSTDGYDRNDGEPFICEACEKPSSGAGSLVRDSLVTTGVGMFQCGSCGKSFSQKGNLDVHARTHTENRRFSCGVCGKSFSRKSAVKAHTLCHAAEKPFKCSMCGRTFSEKKNLACHALTHKADQPAACDVCGKSFYRRSLLKSHVIVHSGEKPFSCDVCGKSFSRKPHLRVHARTHTEERPFRCVECGKAFRRKDHLTDHAVIHTGVRPFSCGVCGKSFCRKAHKEMRTPRISHMWVHVGLTTQSRVEQATQVLAMPHSSPPPKTKRGLLVGAGYGVSATETSEVGR